MAKCTENERKLIDAFIEGYHDESLTVAVMTERLSKKERDEFKAALKASFYADDNRNKIRDRMIAQYASNRCLIGKVLDQIEAEAYVEIQAEVTSK